MNLYEVVTDSDRAGRRHRARSCASSVSELKRILKIPIAVKVSPFFAAFGNVARQLDAAGADGTRPVQPLLPAGHRHQDDDRVAHVELSTSAELLLRLRWLAILYGRVRPSLAVTGGVATPDDGIKAMLAGADAVQMVSAILRHGPSYLSRDARGPRALDGVARSWRA